MKHCGVDAIAPGSPTSLRRFTEARGGIIGQLSVDRGQWGERGGGGGAHGWPVAVWEQHARAMSQLERRSTGVYLKSKDACI